MRMAAIQAGLRTGGREISIGAAMKIGEVIDPAFSRLDLSTGSKSELMRLLSSEASSTTGLPEKEILNALNTREALGSTGIGQGIGLPHAAVSGLKQPFSLAVRLKSPVDFDSIDGLPVDIVVLVLIPDGEGRPHVDRLACVAKQLRSPKTQGRIRAARSVAELYNAFVADDA